MVRLSQFLQLGGHQVELPRLWQAMGLIAVAGRGADRTGAGSLEHFGSD